MTKQNQIKFLGRKIVAVNGNNMQTFRSGSAEYEVLRCLFTMATEHAAGIDVKGDVANCFEHVKGLKPKTEIKKVINDIVYKGSDNSIFVLDSSELLNKFKL